MGAQLLQTSGRFLHDSGNTGEQQQAAAHPGRRNRRVSRAGTDAHPVVAMPS